MSLWDVVVGNALAVYVATMSTTATVGALAAWHRLKKHDRDLYGDDRAEQRGVVPKVEENETRSKRNKRRINRHHGGNR